VGEVTVVTKPDSLTPLNFTIRNAGGSSFKLAFDGVPGFTYRLQYSQDLINWQMLATITADEFGVCQYTDAPPANAPARFYRAQPSLGILGHAGNP
jgi:hypothetical protein